MPQRTSGYSRWVEFFRLECAFTYNKEMIYLLAINFFSWNDMLTLNQLLLSRDIFISVAKREWGWHVAECVLITIIT